MMGCRNEWVGDWQERCAKRSVRVGSCLLDTTPSVPKLKTALTEKHQMLEASVYDARFRDMLLRRASYLESASLVEGGSMYTCRSWPPMP